eukprot:5947549-Amphidinium_carterae.1
MSTECIRHAFQVGMDTSSNEVQMSQNRIFDGAYCAFSNSNWKGTPFHLALSLHVQCSRNAERIPKDTKRNTHTASTSIPALLH